MLTKTQKQILNTAIKLSNNGHAILNEYDISYHLKIHPNIVFKAVKVLAEKNLLEYVYASGTKTPQGFVLTSYSLNLKEYNWLQIRIFLCNNLIAILALVVAIIALFLPFQGNNQIQYKNDESVILESVPLSTASEAFKTD
jgi:hypothetical protein